MIKSCGQPSRDLPGPRPDGPDGGVHPPTNVPTGQPVVSTPVTTGPTVVPSHTDGVEAAALDDTINIAPPTSPIAPSSTASPWMKETALVRRKIQFNVENEVNEPRTSAARAPNTPAAKYRMDPWDELDEMFVSEDQMSVSDDSQEFEDAEDPDPKDKTDEDLSVSRPRLVSGVTTLSLSTPHSHGLFFSSQEGLILLFGFYFQRKIDFLTPF